MSSDVSGPWFYTPQRGGRVRGELNLPSSTDCSDGGETMAEGRGCSKEHYSNYIFKIVPDYKKYFIRLLNLYMG